MSAADAPAAAQDEEVTLEAGPAPVQATLTRAAADGTLVKLRKVTEGAKAVAQQTGTCADPRDGGYRFRTGGR